MRWNGEALGSSSPSLRDVLSRVPTASCLELGRLGWSRSSGSGSPSNGSETSAGRERACRREPRGLAGNSGGLSWPPGPAWGLRLLGECSLLVLRKTADVAASDGPSAGSQLAHPSQALGAGSEDPPRSQSSYRFPLPPPLPNPARMPRLPPCSLFSFDRRWSIFLRPLSCFCFATRTPISGGRNPSTLGSSGSASCVATSREGVRGAGSGGSLYSPLRGSGMPSLPALPPRLIVVAADHASGISVWAGRRRGSTWQPVP